MRTQRADIDGLRALAVLSVMFHHYLVPGFAGGFVGVDVFFVISGFLIADHIQKDLDGRRFSLLAFYERRIRRILPALFVMYALFLVAASQVFFPPDLRFQTQLARFVIPFLANHVFYANAGSYGGEFASHIGLLHTWSLAVEEQFYLVFPLLMLAIARFAGSRYLGVLWPIALLSLVSSVVGTSIAPSAAFYLAPSRAWELLAGALLAVGGFTPLTDNLLRAAFASLGLVLIAGSDLFLSADLAYPGAWALLPCAGAAAIIYARCDRTVAVGKMIDNPLLRGIGLCSYSLYLIHWPLLVLTQYYFLDPLTWMQRCVLLALTFVLGALSWRYIEQPFRGPHATLTRRGLFGIATALAVVLLAATIAVYHAEDPRHYSARERERFPAYTPGQARCKNASPEKPSVPLCKLGDATATVSAVLWGDSHALAILPAVDSAYAQHRQAVVLAEQGGCPPLVGVNVRDLSAGGSRLALSWIIAHGLSRRCEQHIQGMLKWLADNHVDTVILAAHWISYTGDAYPRWLTDDKSPQNYLKKENAAVFARGLGRLLALLQREKVHVFLVEDAPQVDVNVPYALAAVQRLDVNRDFRISQAQYETQQAAAVSIFASLQQRFDFTFLRPQDSLCVTGICSLQRDGKLLYSDGEHLSEAGAMASLSALEKIWNP